jgi:hypothetical protein
MKAKEDDLEFEAVMGPDGNLRVPDRVRVLLGKHAGTRLSVRLIPRVIAGALARHNVSDGEVERIASVQLESREQVITFLLSEGALARRRKR